MATTMVHSAFIIFFPTKWQCQVKMGFQEASLENNNNAFQKWKSINCERNIKTYQSQLLLPKAILEDINSHHRLSVHSPVDYVFQTEDIF